MIKNDVYDVTVCNERNELADALKEKKPAIEISGKLKEELLAEINKQKQGKMSKFMNGFGKFGTVVGLLGFLVPEVAIFEILDVVLGGVVMQLFFRDKSEFSRYNIAFARTKFDIILLLGKNFNSEYDSLKGYETYSMIEPKRTKCPKCGEKLKDLQKEYKDGINPGMCYKCHTPYIWFVEPQKASKKK